MKKKNAKKSLLFGLSLALASVSIFGCGNSDSKKSTDSSKKETQKDNTEALESGDVELTVWAEGANGQTIAKMVESFQNEYKGQANFTITVEESADADTRNNVLGDIHNSADIFSMPDDQLYSMIAGGALMPIPNQEEIRNANLEEAVAAASYNDTIYAYPYSADNGYFLYYDKKYFSESDVETLDQILSICKS